MIWLQLNTYMTTNEEIEKAEIMGKSPQATHYDLAWHQVEMMCSIRPSDDGKETEIDFTGRLTILVAHPEKVIRQAISYARDKQLTFVDINTIIILS